MDQFEKVRNFFSADHFASEMGIIIDTVEENFATAHFDVCGKHQNANGVCQGGAIFTLCDTIAAVAVNSKDLSAVSIQSNINYISAGKVGRIDAEARVVVDHHKLPSVDVLVKQGDVIVAKANFLCYRKTKKV